MVWADQVFAVGATLVDEGFKFYFLSAAALVTSRGHVGLWTYVRYISKSLKSATGISANLLANGLC